MIWRDFELSSSKKNFGTSFTRSTDGGLTFSQPKKMADLEQYLPFDTARDCGDGPDACPAGFVFSRVPLEPRITSDPTGALPGVYAVVQATDTDTITESDTSYFSTNTPGTVGRGVVQVYRSVNDGATWTGPITVTTEEAGHQIFPDVDALDGKLAVLWQDSRTDPCYSIQLPIGNTAAATEVRRAGRQLVRGRLRRRTHVRADDAGLDGRQQPAVRDVRCAAGAVLRRLQLDPAHRPGSRDAGERTVRYVTWTDNRNVVAGPDPREAVQDGFE